MTESSSLRRLQARFFHIGWKGFDMPGSTVIKPVLLVFPFGLLSHYLRCLVLCRYLRPYFDIRFLYHSDLISFIEEEEFETFKCQKIDAARAVQSVKKFEFGWINEFDLERTFQDEIHVISQYKPVAVLGDHTPTLKMAAEATGVQFISLLNGYLTKYYEGHRGISRTHPAYSLMKLLPESLERILTKQGEKTVFKQIHKPYRRVRQKYDLMPLAEYPEEFEGDLTLICDLPALFPQKHAASGYYPIGPLIYSWPMLQTDRPDWLDRNKKTIYVSMGSTGDWHKMAFLSDPFFARYNVVVTGDNEKVLTGTHITHLLFVNINLLFPFTDLVICHGGNGTIYQALLHEIPVLCKTSHCEQEWNVAAVEINKLGKNLNGISGALDYSETIEEWIGKKGTKQLKHFSNLIKVHTRNLPSEAKNLSDLILKKLHLKKDRRLQKISRLNTD